MKVYETENPQWGFFGTWVRHGVEYGMNAADAWWIASNALPDEWTLEQRQAFLDSTAGRHLADTCTDACSHGYTPTYAIANVLGDHAKMRRTARRIKAFQHLT